MVRQRNIKTVLRCYSVTVQRLFVVLFCLSKQTTGQYVTMSHDHLQSHPSNYLVSYHINIRRYTPELLTITLSKSINKYIKLSRTVVIGHYQI